MNKTNKRFNVRNLVFMALICALAYICTFVLHIKVSFLTFDLKNTVFAIGSLIFGPVSAIVTSLVVALLEMITISDTGIWGCIMNFLSGAVYAFFVGLVYKYKKTLSGAMLGLAVGSVATVLLMCLLLTRARYLPARRQPCGFISRDVRYLRAQELISQVTVSIHLTKKPCLSVPFRCL